MVAFEMGLNVYGAKERQLGVGPARRQNHAQEALRGGSSRSPCGSLVGIELMWQEGMRPGAGDGLVYPTKSPGTILKAVGGLLQVLSPRTTWPE